jgi:TRAP-type C4-dicarboxylate transport system permease small subunit
VSRRRGLALGALIAVGGHQAVLAVGHDNAASDGGLQAAAHPAAWGIAVALVVLAALWAAAWIGWRIVALRLRLADIPSLRLPRGDSMPATWLRLLATAVLIFLLQENAEHLAAHGHLPLLDPLLSGQYQATVPIFSGLALLVTIASLAIGTRLADLGAAVWRLRSQIPRAPKCMKRWQSVSADRRLLARLCIGLSDRRGPPIAVPV